MNAHQYHPLFSLALLPRQSKPQGQAGEGQWPDRILLGTYFFKNILIYLLSRYIGHDTNILITYCV